MPRDFDHDDEIPLEFLAILIIMIKSVENYWKSMKIGRKLSRIDETR